MADVILALVLVVGGGTAAELVRTTCRKQLRTPVGSSRGTALPH